MVIWWQLMSIVSICSTLARACLLCSFRDELTFVICLKHLSNCSINTGIIPLMRQTREFKLSFCIVMCVLCVCSSYFIIFKIFYWERQISAFTLKHTHTEHTLTHTHSVWTLLLQNIICKMTNELRSIRTFVL